MAVTAETRDNGRTVRMNINLDLSLRKPSTDSTEPNAPISLRSVRSQVTLEAEDQGYALQPLAGVASIAEDAQIFYLLVRSADCPTGDPESAAGAEPAAVKTILISALTEIATRTGTRIVVDKTVRPIPVRATTDGLSVTPALNRVLEGTPYAFRELSESTFLVYRPITESFQGEDLRAALHTIGATAGVPVTCDPNVTGRSLCGHSGRAVGKQRSMSCSPAVPLSSSRPQRATSSPIASYAQRPRPGAQHAEPGHARSTTAPGTITATFVERDLMNVLTEIARRTGRKIAVDLEVESKPVTAELTEATAEVALQTVLNDTGCAFKRTDDDTYLVFRLITATFEGEDLRKALHIVSTMAGEPIICEPNVTGKVWADIKDVPLETALEIMLTDSPYVVTSSPDGYVIAERDTPGPCRSRDPAPRKKPSAL